MNNIYVTRSSMPDKEEYFQEISDLWDSHLLTNMGVKHQTLEKLLKEYLGVESISLFCNGHMALEMAIQAMELSGQVITTPFTFASTTHAIVRNRLEPVFCDIKKSDYTIDADKLEALITPQTSAIIPVHVYGNVCDIEKIDAIAKKYNLKVIYDAAHAFGVTYCGVGIGNYGNASMFSFHATKVFNTIEGGAVSFNDTEFGEKLYRLKNFGICSETVIDDIGANAKMNEFQAAMGICNLRHVEGEIDKRKAVVKRYTDKLKGRDGLCLPPVQRDVNSNYAYFPVFFDRAVLQLSRDDIYEALREHGVFARKYFYPLTNEFQCYKGRFCEKDTPIASRIAEGILTLPLYAELSLESVDFICDIILKRIDQCK